jgi:hypothetical protein
MAQTGCGKTSPNLGSALNRRGEHMRSGYRQRLTWWVSLLVLCWAPLAYSQQVSECRRDCGSEYWKGVSRCYRSNTLYNDVRQCQDAEQLAKRTCKHRCSKPKGPAPRDCRRRCDQAYWDDRSVCYQSSSRYREIRGCETSARGTKDACNRSCPRRRAEEARR